MRIGLLAEKIGMTRFYDKNMINHSVYGNVDRQKLFCEMGKCQSLLPL